MEMDLFNGSAVDFRLGHRQQLENGYSIIDHLLGEAALTDDAADLPQPAVVLMSGFAMTVMSCFAMTVMSGFAMTVMSGFAMTVMSGFAMTVMSGFAMTAMSGFAMIVMSGFAMIVMSGFAMIVMSGFAMTVMNSFMGMPVAIFCRRIHIPAGMGIENVEFGAHQAVFAYLACSDAKTLQPQGRNVFTDNIDIGASVDQCPYEHIAADTGRSIEIKNFCHVICSFRFTPAAILLIISAW
jgi:hypothetical protein